MRTSRADVIADAALHAPAQPGVYFFLGADGAVLYVGKATNLRARLRQHARRTDVPVVEVAWELTADERAAAAREADLIVALQPRCNKAIVAEGRWAYISCTSDGAGEVVRFDVGVTPERAPARVYGCFPHLGVDVSSQAGIACSDGYVAFLRVLWAAAPAYAGRQYPSRIARGSPPARFETAVDATLRAPLDAFLAGRANTLLPMLASLHEQCDAYLRPALRRDLDAANAFYDAGPRALRALRLRHRRRPGPMPRPLIERFLADEVAASIAAFTPSR